MAILEHPAAALDGQRSPDPQVPAGAGQAAARTLFHTRQVVCRGYLRTDGLWDIEGEIVDTKAYDMDIAGREALAAGTPLHRMRLCLTVDDDYVIRDARAFSLDGPYPDCRSADRGYGQLIGLAIGPGFNRQVQERVGNAGGCTHITELLQSVATTAFQTIFTGRSQRDGRQSQDSNPFRPKERARMVNSCWGLRSDGEAVRRHFPEYYTGQ